MGSMMATARAEGTSGARTEMRGRAGRWLMIALALLTSTTLLSGCAGKNEARAYTDYSNFMTSTGRFRQERTPSDAPFGPSDLIRNFEKVAFVPEKQLAAFYAKRKGERRLSKWETPLTYAVVGDGVRESDRSTVAGIIATLSARSSLPMRIDYEQPQLTVFVLTARSRRGIAASGARQSWYDDSLFRDWVETLNPPCFALFDASTPSGGAIRSGAIFIKAEIENPLRDACLVEELTQSMGLIFDHDDVRPSIFNDDQEFIALTEHDEMLLEILYDPRLRAGMTQAEAAPIVRRIVADRVMNGAPPAGAAPRPRS